GRSPDARGREGHLVAEGGRQQLRPGACSDDDTIGGKRPPAFENNDRLVATGNGDAAHRALHELRAAVAGCGGQLYGQLVGVVDVGDAWEEGSALEVLRQGRLECPEQCTVEKLELYAGLDLVPVLRLRRLECLDALEDVEHAVPVELPSQPEPGEQPLPGW